jgi:hypothetical protein
MIPLTIQKPDLISYLKVPVLRYPFRKEELYFGGERTTRKIPTTITSLRNSPRRAILCAYPMIWTRTKRIRSIAGGTINSAEGHANRTAYLVRQGQQEVIEEDCGDRNCIILIPIPCQHSRSKKMMKNDAHPRCGAEDFGVQRSGKSSHGREERKGAHRL